MLYAKYMAWAWGWKYSDLGLCRGDTWHLTKSQQAVGANVVQESEVKEMSGFFRAVIKSRLWNPAWTTSASLEAIRSNEWVEISKSRMQKLLGGRNKHLQTDRVCAQIAWSYFWGIHFFLNALIFFLKEKSRLILILQILSVLDWSCKLSALMFSG